MKEELIKYVMGEADKCYADDFPIEYIENWINDFFELYQPERLSEKTLYNNEDEVRLEEIHSPYEEKR